MISRPLRGGPKKLIDHRHRERAREQVLRARSPCDGFHLHRVPGEHERADECGGIIFDELPNDGERKQRRRNVQRNLYRIPLP